MPKNPNRKGSRWHARSQKNSTSSFPRTKPLGESSPERFAYNADFGAEGPLLFQQLLAETFGYKPLDGSLTSKVAREIHQDHFESWRAVDDGVFPAWGSNKRLLSTLRYSRNLTTPLAAKSLASGDKSVYDDAFAKFRVGRLGDCLRLVTGDYGSFFEIPDSAIVHDNVVVAADQAYRFSQKWHSRVKYEWWTTHTDPTIKLYRQLRKVAYADYRPNYWYVSPYQTLIC